MWIDLSDLGRLEGIAEGLGRIFWCLMAVAFFATILGSAGTGFLVLILGAGAFAGRIGLEDFVRSRHEQEERSAAKPRITVRRTPRARRSANAPTRR